MRLALLLIVLASLVHAQPAALGTGSVGTGGEDLASVPDPIREDLMHGRWDAAVAKLELMATARPEDTDLWLLLAGVAHDRAGRSEEALAALRAIETNHVDSPWVAKARFRQAEIHRARGEYQAAEAIYEAAVRHLRSPERQGELAGIYLEYADDASTPPAVPTPGHRLDYDRAFQLYAKVLELEAPRDLRDKALYRMAHCMEQTGNHDVARQRFEIYLTEFDPTRQRPLPAGFVSGQQLWDARHRLGLAELNSGRGAQARRTFEDLADDLRAARKEGSLSAEEHTRIGDALYDLARTYGGGNDGAQLGTAAYQRFLDAHPTHIKSTVAAFAIAELWRGSGQLDDAAEAYRVVVERAAPATADTDVLAEHQRLVTRSLYLEAYSRHAGARYDDAIALYTDYARRHPNGPDWAACQQGIVDAMFQIGADHRAQERFDEARVAWNKFLAAHPLDHRSDNIQFDLGQMKLEESAVRRREASDADVKALLRDAIDIWARVISKYPGSHEASRALYQTGFLQETELGELESAIDSYRACNFGNFAGQAQARLTQMIEPSLELFTERSWRTNEPAKVKLFLRNVEEVEVERYALDLEAYFRKHLTHRHVEDLDLDLIAPDERSEVPVANYAKYAPLEQEIDLGVEGPGVWAVTVKAGELSATTLVIRSDVDVIVKSSRREVFVFAQDVKDGGPQADVQVLVALPNANGEATLEELTTAADGIARLELEGLANANEVRILAVHDGSYASDGLTLSGLSMATGLSPRGHVATDRTAYRPGDEVRWRAILRDVENGSYHFEPGGRVDVEIRDSQGRSFHQAAMTLSDFGTVHGVIALPEQAPLGTYNISLTRPGVPQVGMNFDVQQYQLQKVELTLEPTEPVIYRGEEVIVTARAAYYYGAPVVDSPLSYQLPDGRVLEARTDARGEVEIRFGTRDFLNEGGLYVGATLREEGVSSSTQVWLATRGFTPTVSTPKPIVIAGDSFPVSIHTQSPSGEDVARELTVEVLRRESAPGGQWRQVVVETHTIRTAEDGAAHLSFALSESGQHWVRATGIDRFGNPVSGETQVYVSGDDDTVKLRLLAESNRTRVGDQLTFELVNRAGPGLALVTFEGETILGYRLVELTEGRNELTLDVDHAHFPNIAVAAAMMDGTHLREASSPFDVSRELIVKVTPKAGVLEPGGEAEVELTVTDQLGNPVVAELALSVVDASLFDLYPDTTQALRAFFESGARREAGLRTTSSCAFAYHGVTTTIDEAILEERDRAEAQQRWREDRTALRDNLSALGYSGGDGEARMDRLVALAKSGPSTPGPAGPSSPGAASRPAGDDGLASSSETGSGSDDFFFLGRGEGGPAGGEAARKSRGRRANKDASRALAGEALTPEFDAHTAFWSPAVVTDEAGKGTLKFNLPEKSTRWRLTARGVSAETLVGDARAELVTKSDFFVELLTPLALVEGDQPRFAARVHNLTGKTGEAELVLTVRAGQQRRFQTARVTLGESAVVEHRFEALPGVDAADLELELKVEATLGDATAVATADDSIPVRPWGLELMDSASGSIADASTLWLELPDGRRYDHRRLELHIGPSVDRVLIEEALGQSPFPTRKLGGTSHAAVASDLVGTCAVLRSMQSSGGEQPEYAELRSRAAGLLASLAAAQSGDGGWPWVGRGSSSPMVSATVVLGLAAAQDAGLQPPAPTLTSASNFVRDAYRGAGSASYELRAALVHAQAALGQGDFSAANSLHRERNRLSPAALAHTVLALARMDRAPMAADVAALLENELKFDANTGRAQCSVEGNIAWSRSPVDMTALAVLALEAGLPRSTRIAAGVESLLASRPWSSQGERGLAVAAVAQFERENERLDDRATLTVAVGDADPIEVILERDGAGMHFVLPLAGDGRRVPLRFALEGRAAPHVAARLVGFTANLSALGKDPGFRVLSQSYHAEPRRYQGQSLPVGFGVLSNRSETWTNEVDHLELGGKTKVHVYVDRDRVPDGGIDDFLVVDIALPGGAKLLEGSLSGGVGSHEQRDGHLIVPLGQGSGRKLVSFELLGLEPGAYRQLPAVVHSAYEPGRRGIGKADALTVLGRGEASPDDYRPTPDELFHHGRLLFEHGDLAAAGGKLGQLYGDHEGNLRTSDLRALARMMLTASLDQRDAASAVRFFEVLREKDSGYTVPFDQIVAIGEAYRDLGEFERAYLIFRATALETFGKDLEVAGTLQDQGERAGALDVLDELTLAYPDLPSVVEARLALADQLLSLAPAAHRDGSLVRADYDRAALTQRGILLLKRFLALHPDSSLAPDAGLGLVSAYLGMDDADTAARLAGEMAELYTQPRFADAFTYTQAVAQWHLGQEDQAQALLGRIASAEYTDERGNKSHSENRDLALYILGQIAHARQDADTAEEYYDRVDHLYSDAKEALTGFRHRALVLEEVTTARPGEAVSLDLDVQNLGEVELLVYGVDLMTLYLREKDLSQITSVNLAGIAPTLQATIDLTGARDLREREAKAELSLTKPGAYLVIARSGGLHASGLILVTDLELEVAEDPVSGRVRVQALDRGDGHYPRDVDVRVVGTGGGRFVNGETDPRGLFVADGVSGSATVVARQGDHYAFHRGVASPRTHGGVRQMEAMQQLDNRAYYQNVIDFNGSNVQQRGQNLMQEMRKDRRGVQLEQIK